MNEQESQPLVKGAINVDALTSSPKERISFPVGKMIKVHTGHEGRIIQQPKMITTKDGEEKEIIQNKVLYTFVVEDDIQDTETKASLKGKTFTKAITLSKHERATYPVFIAAVCGGYRADPFDAMGKPLQVLFQPWQKFGDFDYQPITYLPPADGQTAPTKDVLPSGDDVTTDLDALFDQALGGK